MYIFLLEDDIALQNSIKLFLESKGAHVDTFYDGESALEAIDKQSYSLYLLDINVPGIDGLKLLELIHLYNQNAKVLMISATTDIDTISKAYRLGSLDYLKKPFFIEELYYKVKILTQEVSTKSQNLPVNEHLTKKEKVLLELLLTNTGNTITYEEIEEQVYTDFDMTPDALRGLIKRLRKKLIDYNIKSISGIGYLLEKNKENNYHENEV